MTDVMYDSVQEFFGLYILTLGSYSNIMILENGGLKRIVNDCNIISKINKTLVFEVDGKKGIVFVTGGAYPYFLQSGFGEVEYLGCNNFYKITYNGKKGITSDKRVIISADYHSIKVGCPSKLGEKKDKNFWKNVDTLYCSLKRENGSYDFATISNSTKEATLYQNKNITDIKLYSSIMVFQVNDSTLVYDYEGKLLARFPFATIIRPYYGIRFPTYYLVDGAYYQHQKGQFKYVSFILEDSRDFENHLKAQPDVYIAAYTGEYGTVVVNETNEVYYENACAEIERLGSAEFEGQLETYFRTHLEVQELYPELILKKDN